MSEHERAQQPQPRRGVLTRNAGVAQSLENGRQTVAAPFEPKQMHEHEEHQHDRDEPRFDGMQRSAAALGDGREDCQRAEQDERRIAREQHAGPPPSRARTRSRGALARPHASNAASTIAHSAMVRIGGPNSGVGTVNSEMPTISSTAMAACARPDDRAGQREDAPVSRDHANLRQRIDAEQAGQTKRDLGKPIGELRADIAVELKFVADGEKLRQVAGRPA